MCPAKSERQRGMMGATKRGTRMIVSSLWGWLRVVILRKACTPRVGATSAIFVDSAHDAQGVVFSKESIVLVKE